MGGLTELRVHLRQNRDVAPMIGVHSDMIYRVF